MKHKIIVPDADELVSVSIRTSFLLVDEPTIESSHLILSAGQVPTGAAGFSIFFGDTDYGAEMASAVRAVINEVNDRWGLNVDWSPRTRRFTGMRAEPFATRDGTTTPLFEETPI